MATFNALCPSCGLAHGFGAVPPDRACVRCKTVIEWTEDTKELADLLRYSSICLACGDFIMCNELLPALGRCPCGGQTRQATEEDLLGRKER